MSRPSPDKAPKLSEAIILEEVASVARWQAPPKGTPYTPFAFVVWRQHEGQGHGHLGPHREHGDPAEPFSEAVTARAVALAVRTNWGLFSYGTPKDDPLTTPLWSGWVEVRDLQGGLLSRTELRSLDHPPSDEIRAAWARGDQDLNRRRAA